MNETRALASFVARTRFADLPRALVGTEACEKFRRYTASVLDAERATTIIDTIGRLEQVADMADVARLVARTSTTP